MMPFLREASKRMFVKILSIKVAVVGVTLVGLFIKGIAPFWKALL